MDIKEISRRCEADETGGMDGCAQVIAEMVVEVDGVRKYLTCVWVSLASEDLSMEITEKPTLDLYMDLDTYSDDLEEIQCSEFDYEGVGIDEEYTGPYQEQFAILRKMVIDRAKKEEFLCFDD